MTEQGRGQGERVGVVFVHGIGSQERSSTLRLFGDPLVEFLTKWHADPARSGALGGRTIELDSFLSYGDALPPDTPAHLVVRLPRFAGGDGAHPPAEWLLTEGWWAARLEAPSFAAIAGWGVLAYFRALLRLISALLYVRAFDDRARDLRAAVVRRLPSAVGRRLATGAGVRMPGPGEPVETVPPPSAGPLMAVRARWNAFAHGLGLAYDRLALLALVVAYAVVGVPALFLVVLPLALIAQIPFVPQNAVLSVLRVFLTANIGDFYVYLFDEIQALHIRRGVLASIEWLERQRCDRICVVAHSQGCVVAFDALTQGDHPRPVGTARVTKLITMGEALNAAWQLKPAELRRVPRTLPPVRWVDFWSFYDPVPGSRPGVGEGPHFEDIQVTNRMDVLVEHDGYFTNTEEVISRLAEEIDVPGDRRAASRFWLPKVDDWDERVRRRRWRVRTLLFWRSIGIVLFGSALYVRRELIGRDGLDLFTTFGWIPGVRGVADVVAVLPFGLDQVAYVFVGIAAAAALFELAYLLAVAPLWHYWDAHARDAAIGLALPSGRRWVPYIVLVSALAVTVFALVARIVLRAF